MNIGVRMMNDAMSYVLVILALLSILMMLDIDEKYIIKRDLVLQILMMFSMLVIIYNIFIFL